MVNAGYQVFDQSHGQLRSRSERYLLAFGADSAAPARTVARVIQLFFMDQLADRWVISQFASATGGAPITDECVAVSTTSDATDSYNRYGFHLGSNFFDYPQPLGLARRLLHEHERVQFLPARPILGRKPFALDRTAMLAGAPATFISRSARSVVSVAPFLPADLDGSALPPAGAPNTFVKFPDTGDYTIFHFHVDFATPANSTFTTFATPAAAGYFTLPRHARLRP